MDNDLSQVSGVGSDVPRPPGTFENPSGSVNSGSVEGQVRSEGGSAASGDVHGVVDSKISELKPDQATRAQGQASEVESVSGRVRNPDVQGEVRSHDDQAIGRAQSADSARGEAQRVVGDPTGAATSRVSSGVEGQVSSHAPVDPNVARSNVDSATSAAHDPKSAAESKIRSDAEVRVDVGVKPPPGDVKK